jgi:hypothetical protein
MDILETLKTGDLILFNNRGGGIFGAFTSLIKWGTHSNYTHIGMILKNPTFIHPSLKGLYVWESTFNGKPDPQDGEIKLGVQITPLKEALHFETRNVFIRKIKCPENTFSNNQLKLIHEQVYKKPYDIVPTDWIEALFHQDSNPQKTDRFWCSALIGYIYTKCGVLDKHTDWSILKPCDFSIEGENLILEKNCQLENYETKLQ